MATKKVKFDFYRFDYENKNELWNKMDSLLPKHDIVRYRGQPIRMQNYKILGDERIGSATKIRMTELPLKANINAPDLDKLELNDDEGITNITAFVIIPKYSTLILQRNQQGVRAGSFIHLLESLIDISDISLDVMLEPDVISKLEKMTAIRTYTLRVTSPIDKDTYEEMSVNKTAELAKHYGGRSIKVEIGMGQGNPKESLLIDKVKQSAKSILKMKSDEQVQVESLIIRGKDFDDEKINPLDLIEQRITCEVEVPISGREYLQNELEGAASRAYNEKKEVIEKYKPL